VTTLAADQTQPAPKETAMNRIQRGMAVLAGLGGTLLTLAAAAPAAFAVPPPPEPAAPAPAEVQAVVTGGMPGWQIALIAVGAALMAAALAVLLDRRRAARQRASATAA
jgi:hypothetical protein